MMSQGLSCTRNASLHSLLVSTILSPNTSPQSPHTRSPLSNSSTIFGLGSLQSGQIKRTARSGPASAGLVLKICVRQLLKSDAVGEEPWALTWGFMNDGANEAQRELHAGRPAYD